MMKKLLKGIGILLIAFVVLAMFLPSGSTEEVVKEEESQTEEVTEEVAEEVVEDEAPEPEVSKEFQNALKKADAYANGMHMSKASVYNQLTSEYGEGFPEDAAQYAMDNVEANWKENALEKAISYQDNMAMSRENIYDQLTSEYGEEFTQEEADYALENLPE